MKIGIVGEGFFAWGGGIDYLRLIASSLIVADPSVELHFLLPASAHYLSPVSVRRKFVGKKIQSIVQAIYRHFGWSIGQPEPPDVKNVIDTVLGISSKASVHFVELGDKGLSAMAQKLELDILLPAMQPLQTGEVPWIGYLYDYQHAYLPELFSAEEVASRNLHFHTMLQEAKHVIVNSQAVADDIDRFNPEHLALVSVLPFAAAPDPVWIEKAPLDKKHYGINRQYFMICNQFWQHKDHLTAWKALALVNKEFPEVELVCTGQTDDNRDANFFTDLVEVANKLGIAPRLKILGFIPKFEQISLLRQAVALIQPTLFEGGPGGGATYDAISLGVPVLLSDILVNREITEPYVTFFPAKDSTALAILMIAELQKGRNRTVPKPEELLERGFHRRLLCGQKLLKIIETATSQKPMAQ